LIERCGVERALVQGAQPFQQRAAGLFAFQAQFAGFAAGPAVCVDLRELVDLIRLQGLRSALPPAGVGTGKAELQQITDPHGGAGFIAHLLQFHCRFQALRVPEATDRQRRAQNRK
jgi:hypothetical protein